MTASRRLPELLAPAGSPEAAFAAFRFGADAVYCGLRSFSARAEAVNFSLEDLRAVVACAHRDARPRRVFVALNTLALTRELPDVAAALAAIADAGADAVIVQDLGVARLARRLAPEVELHASTQLAVHNLAGVRTARALGFAQVTLARELTLAEVRAIVRDGQKVEVFIHGALCYSYSGLCLMSAHRAGRSGNRGRCAYPCREPYRLEATDVEGLAFSMKDLAWGAGVRRLADAGVACLKIEGRMKGPLYVAAVTDYYRRILDGDLHDPAELQRAEDDLRTVFSRSWTTLYADRVRRADVIDPRRTGNLGAPIGTVETVMRDAQGTHWVRFRTARALELHDGVQFELPGAARPYGFGIDRFGGRTRASGPVFEQPAGARVTLALPPDAPGIPPGTPVTCTSSQAVRNRLRSPLPPAAERTPRRPVRVRVAIAAEAVTAEAVTAEARAGGGAEDAPTASVRATGTFAIAQDAGRMRAAVAKTFGRLGATEYRLDALEIDNPENRFVPISSLNALRRALCERLDAACAAAFERRSAAARRVATEAPEVTEATPVPSAAGERWRVRTDDPACLAELDDPDEVVLDWSGLSDAELDAVVAHWGRERVRLALPVIVRGWESETLERRVARLLRRGHRRWLASNLGSWAPWGKDADDGAAAAAAADAVRARLPPGTDLEADWTLPTLNPQALAAWREAGVSGVTLSPEDTRDNIAALLRDWGTVATVVLYQDTPLTISEACPRAALRGDCAGCGGTRDDVALRAAHGGGDALRVVLRGCRAVTIGARPFAWTAHLAELRGWGGRSWRVDFALRRYTPAEAATVWRAARAGRALPDTHAANWIRAL